MMRLNSSVLVVVRDRVEYMPRTYCLFGPRIRASSSRHVFGADLDIYIVLIQTIRTLFTSGYNLY